MRENKLYVLVGKSGVGKDTIYQAIRKDLGLLPVVSTTSRPRRPEEREGVEYYFVSTDVFLQKREQGDFIESRSYNTIQNGKEAVWYYGITKQAIDLSKGNHIAIVDLNGLEKLKEAFGDTVVAIYLKADEKEREKRAIQRGGYEKSEWDRRRVDDDIQFNKERIEKNIDFTVTNNGSLKDTIETVKLLIKNN